MDEKRLFGQVAIQHGFVSVAQVREALAVQKKMREAGETPDLIGEILVDLGHLSPADVMRIIEIGDPSSKR